MSNADPTHFDRAEEAGTSPLRTVAHRFPDRPPAFLAAYPRAIRHIPGDTTTPPAPGAVRIGPEDV